MLPAHKNANPYNIDGRWYHFFIENDAGTLKLTTSDLDGVTIESNIYLTMPDDFHIVDFIKDVHTTTGHSQTMSERIKYNTDGTQALPLPTTVLDYVDVYIFGHFH